MTKTRAEQIYEAFEKFHKANPRVFQLFEHFALEAINSGFKSLGAKAIGEQIRWRSRVETRDGDGVKVNNNFMPYYARLFVALHPEHDGFFRNRQLITQERSASDDDQQVFMWPPAGDEAELTRKLRLLGRGRPC